MHELVTFYRSRLLQSPRSKMFNNSKSSKGKGIYLPICDNEDNLKGRIRGNGRQFRRPYLMILMMIMLLITIVIGIGVYMFNIGTGNDKDEFAIRAGMSSVPPLILISIDGFRYDYLKRGLTPSLRKLCRKGIHGPMKPQFPSYTFPNHFSLVTGLYPESHGIVGNTFYDPKFEEYFSYNNQKDLLESKWWLAEPIWNTIQKFGLKSATMFWPGSESSILGRRPNYYKTYDGSVSTNERADQVLKWLDLPEEEKPKFISMYLSLVDEAGHMFGPDSKELNRALIEADSGIERLLIGLKERGIDDIVNLIIVSDHGMIEIKHGERYHIYLDDIISDMKERLQWVDYGPMASIIPMPGEDDSIISELRNAQMHGIPFMVFKRDELPSEYHYAKSDRIAPIILVAKKGYVIDFRGGDWVPRGAHGYDPNLPEMQALLIATGPQFRDPKHSAGRRINRAIKGVSNLDVYPLMMNLLKITPSPNNGTLALVNMIK
jgi:predicted AlkP superfamily pyrophosphatase or phosphodiesterase